MPRLRSVLALLMLSIASAAAVRAEPLLEVHQRLDTRAAGHEQDVALTLDACGGAYDAALIATLVRLRIPATLFVTERWLRRNPAALRELQSHPELFEFENHGRDHVPAAVGRRLYGMAGPATLAGVEREVVEGRDAVARATGRAPAWYRGAGAAYDAASRRAIGALGARIAGFSLNGDDGATLGAAGVARRLRGAAPGEIVLAHMNHPEGGTARGLAAALPELQRRGLRFVRLSQAAGVLGEGAPPRHD